MAVKELNNVAVYNVHIQANGQDINNVPLYAGMVLTTDTKGNACAAVRGIASGNGSAPYKESILGLLADNVSGTGETDIYIDPVGSTTIDPTTGLLVDNSNASYAAARRQAFSYNFAEQINNVTNFTAAATGGGFQGPARGVGYYVAPSQVQVDSQILIQFQTGDNVGSSTVADVALATPYMPGDLLTYGVAANAGKLVRATVGQIFEGQVVARIDAYNGSGQVANITLI